MTDQEYIIGAMRYARAALGDFECFEKDVDPSPWEAVKWLIRAEDALERLIRNRE